MDQSLDRVSIVVKHEYSRVQAQFQHIRKRLNGQMEAAFASDEDTSFVMLALPDSLERSHCSSSSVAYATEYGLVVHAGTAG